MQEVVHACEGEEQHHLLYLVPSTTSDSLNITYYQECSDSMLTIGKDVISLLPHTIILKILMQLSI